MSYLHETEPSHVSLFFGMAEKLAEKTFTCAKVKGGDNHSIWEKKSWKDTARNVSDMGAGLIAKGTESGDTVGLFSENSPEWIISDLAIQGAGAVSVPINPGISAHMLVSVINDCKIKTVISGNSLLLKKILKIKKDTSSLKNIICLENIADISDSHVISWDDFLSDATNNKDAQNEFEKRKTSISEDDTAAIIYTQGTTGDPRGFSFSHGDFMAKTRALLKLPVMRNMLERNIHLETLCHLPLWHITSRIYDYHTNTALGSVIYFAENMGTVQKNIFETQPQMLVSVPYLYEKIYESALSYGEKLEGIKRDVFEWAIKTGKKISEFTSAGRAIPIGLTIRLAIANILVFRHIRSFTGLNRLVSAISSGGHLSSEASIFFRAMNIVFAESFDMTETAGPVTLNGHRLSEPLPDDSIHKKALNLLVDTLVVEQSTGTDPFSGLKGYMQFLFYSRLVLTRMVTKPGYAGRPLDETLMKTGENNEILVKVPLIFKEKDMATTDFTDEGFYKTGVTGKFDDQGYLRISGRKEYKILSSDDKVISPEQLELHINMSPLIDRSCVVSGYENRITAVIVPQFRKLELYAKMKKITVENRTDLLSKTEVISLFRTELEKINRKLEAHEMIRAFCLTPEPFTVQSGELTHVFNIRRHVIIEKHKEKIKTALSCA